MHQPAAMGFDELRHVVSSLQLPFQSSGTLDMKTAFLGFRILPPPSSGTNVLARLNGSGAWGAAYAGKALVVEPVIRNLTFADVIPHLLLRPIDLRINLENSPVILI